MTELERMLEKIPEPMRSALRDQEPAFAAEMARDYLDADAASQGDILDFFRSDGPRMVDEARAKHEDGTPTSDELERWAGLGDA